MITSNPFAELSALIPPDIMQAYVVLMVLLVIGGTLIDVIHKKSAKYFFENAQRAKKAAKREVGAGEKIGLAVSTVANEVLTSGEFDNPQRRISHLFTMYGFIVFVVTTAMLIFGLSGAEGATAAGGMTEFVDTYAVVGDPERCVARLQELVAALASDDPVLRERSREALVAAATCDVTRELVGELTDPRQHVRWEAAKALSAIADPISAPALVDALDDDDDDVRDETKSCENLVPRSFSSRSVVLVFVNISGHNHINLYIPSLDLIYLDQIHYN